MKSVLSLALLLLPVVALAGPETRPVLIDKKMADFKLRDYRGVERSLSDSADRKVVVIAFLGTECPVARLYAARLADLAKEFEPKGVAFLGIISNQQDGVTAIGQFAKAFGLTFPILKDVGNVIADQFGAQRTPEVFVLDKERVLRYTGRIDDQYGIGYTRPKAQQNDLAVALGELLAGKPVSIPVTPAVGCYIGRVQLASKQGSITYSKHIAPLLQKHCVECHRPGEIAPFALTSYEDASGWAETMVEVVKEQRMPPWHASPKYGHFANECRLRDDEKQLLYDWVKGGTPEGDRKDLPPPAAYTQGWRIPKPDVVFTLAKPFTVPAEGAVQYQYFVMDTSFTEDKWIKAAEVHAGARSAVHHILVFVQPPGGKTDRHGGFASNWLAATVPGAWPMRLPEGTAKLIPAGSRLLFQIHYTPNGAVQHDQSSIGLVFADPKTVRREVKTEMVANPRFRIPPGAEDHPVEADLPLEQDTILLSLMPHTHLRGKAFQYEAIYPNGDREMLLDVPKYDFNWQNSYVLAEPKRLPKGTTLHCLAQYDNSAKNLSNPNPKVAVTWGDQTWQEMMIGYVDIVSAEEDLLKNPRKQATAPLPEKPDIDTGLKKLAAKALQSDADFAAFATAVKKAHPKVDRVCVTVCPGEKLRVERAAYPGDVTPHVAESGFEISGHQYALAFYALIGRFVVHTDIKKAQAPDMMLMSKTLKSSMHVPISLEGRVATVNFWSKQEDAFSIETQKALRAVGEIVAQGK